MTVLSSFPQQAAPRDRATSSKSTSLVYSKTLYLDSRNLCIKDTFHYYILCRIIPPPDSKETSLFRIFSCGPNVSIIERFHCTRMDGFDESHSLEEDANFLLKQTTTPLRGGSASSPPPPSLSPPSSLSPPPS